MNDTFMKTKPVFPLLVSMALPNVISMLVNSLYNIVDSLFVAQINEQAMTALSLVFPIQNFVNAVAIGFGVGINALVALYRGAGDHDRADAAATHGMALSVLHGILCTLAATAIMPGFLARFTADGTIVSMGVTYSTIVFLFATVNMASLAFEKLFQAVGRMKLTMIALISGCVCNILLDPVLIFGLGPVPAMGIAGAALATGIGQAATLVIYLVVYSTTESPVHLRRKALRPDLSLEGRLYAIGVPAILNLALPSLLVTFLNGLLAAFSESYVVVLGIYLVRQQAEKGGDSPFSGILPDSSANNSVGADEDTFTDEVTPSDGGLAFSSGPADYVLTGHPELAQQARQWLSQQGLEPDEDGVYSLTVQQVQGLNAAVPELELPTDDALRLLLED